MNRPERLNAITRELLLDLRSALECLDADPDRMVDAVCRTMIQPDVSKTWGAT